MALSRFPLRLLPRSVGHKVWQGQTVQTAPMAHRALKGFKAHKVLQDPRDPKALKDHRVRWGPPFRSPVAYSRSTP